MQHSRTETHRCNMKKFNSKSRQLNLKEMVDGDEKEQELQKKARQFEIDLTRRLESHYVSFSFMPCLIDCLKTNLGGESAIVNKVELGRSKANYLAKFGIGKTNLDETIQKLRKCDGFSIGFDESEVNKNHECKIMVMLSMPETGIEPRHYRTISLDATDAESIVDALLEQMDDDQIPWRQKLIAPKGDQTNDGSGADVSADRGLAAAAVVADGGVGVGWCCW